MSAARGGPNNDVLFYNLGLIYARRVCSSTPSRRSSARADHPRHMRVTKNKEKRRAPVSPGDLRADRGD